MVFSMSRLTYAHFARAQPGRVEDRGFLFGARIRASSPPAGRRSISLTERGGSWLPKAIWGTLAASGFCRRRNSGFYIQQFVVSNYRWPWLFSGHRGRTGATGRLDAEAAMATQQ